MMMPTPCGSAIVAPTAPLRLTAKFSGPSGTASALTTIAICWDVTPGGKEIGDLGVPGPAQGDEERLVRLVQGVADDLDGEGLAGHGRREGQHRGADGCVVARRHGKVVAGLRHHRDLLAAGGAQGDGEDEAGRATASLHQGDVVD